MSSSIAIVLSEKVNNSLLRIAEECVLKAVELCASKYNFSAEEAIKELGVFSVSVETGKNGKKVGKKVEKKVEVKPSFPLPYNGEKNEECCSALRQNNGLYTQCTGVRRGESPYCKGCVSQMQKKGAEVPEYGTIEMRKAVGIFEYVDPKGRKPVAYTKVMKKYKLTEEQVIEEAKKLNMEINPEHFAQEQEVKRGRPKTVEKEPKEKGNRGRPKKTNKVVEVDGDTEDLFATLVANANEEVEEVVKSEDEKKKEKEAKLAADKAAKQAAKEAEKAAKEAAKEAEKAAKEAEKAAKEAAKKEKEEQAKKEKEAKLAAKEAAKASKKSEKKVEKVSPEQAGEKEDDEEPDVVKKIEFEGKKYLKSKKTGIIYDYNEYVKNGEQVVVGKWNDASNKIEFNAAEDEEDEEEYEM
jgi:chemotaxis protein histidine kinase CheA